MAISTEQPMTAQRSGGDMDDELRTLHVSARDIAVDGKTIHGYAVEFNTLSEDLGGFRERIAPGAFAGVLADADVRLLVDHAGVPLARTKAGTLKLNEDERGLAFEAELPDTPRADELRESIRRGDLDGMSFRFSAGEDEWEDGDERVRTVKSVASLTDVCLATYPAYTATSVSLRTQDRDSETETRDMDDEGRDGGTLRVEDTEPVEEETRSIEDRVGAAMRTIRKGERRSLTNAADSGGPISPPEVGTYLWDNLRPASIALASGIRVVSTDRQKVTWPQLVSDVDPTWVEELEAIPADEPGFDSLEADPKKLAHLVSPISNEVLDDSEPSAAEVLRKHLITMLGLKLDKSIFEGPSSNAKSITGLRDVSGIQTISMGTNGAALSDYDLFIQAVGMLRDANVPGPYAIATHGSVLTALELLKDESGSNKQLGKPDGLPPIHVSSQFAITETKGTSSNSRSAYVYAPSQLVLVRRKAAEVELDRSRLFNIDASEMRGVLRADLLVPNPVAVVRISGILPPS